MEEVVFTGEISAIALRQKQAEEKAKILKHSLKEITSLMNDIFSKINKAANANCETQSINYEIDNSKYCDTIIYEVVDILRSKKYHYSVEIYHDISGNINKLVISW